MLFVYECNDRRQLLDPWIHVIMSRRANFMKAITLTGNAVLCNVCF